MKVIWRKSRMTFFFIFHYKGIQEFRNSGWSVPEPVEGTMFSASTSSATLIQKFRDSEIQGLR